MHTAIKTTCERHQEGYTASLDNRLSRPSKLIHCCCINHRRWYRSSLPACCPCAVHLLAVTACTEVERLYTHNRPTTGCTTVSHDEKLPVQQCCSCRIRAITCDVAAHQVRCQAGGLVQFLYQGGAGSPFAPPKLARNLS